ncbi:MAG: imidazole glycerol phosphate synthase cyclase subunit [Gemmiger sp.]|nr:imidazole glycerol phosphate synthase cyclase subunit [Gemmiger sp.]
MATTNKKIRLVARLDVKDDHLVKGIQLEGLRKLGDPNGFAKEYYEQGIDELLYVDIVASLYNRNNLSGIVRKTVEDVYIPVCVGGGLRSTEDVRHILSMGADKVAVNTAAIKRPALITEIANAFGSQCMVLSIQAKKSRTQPGKWEAYYDNGRAHSGYDVVEWAKRGVALGAGEILLMSVDCEGLQRGMDLDLIRAVTGAVNVPVICGGGVGCAEDIVDAANAGADAVATAAVLHYKKAAVPELKAAIRSGGVEVR